jgi:hypothetical protein
MGSFGWIVTYEPAIQQNYVGSAVKADERSHGHAGGRADNAKVRVTGKQSRERVAI